MQKKTRTRPDGRSRTFENRFAFYLRQLRSEYFADVEPTGTEQTRLELAALISARIERLRVEMFEHITDTTDDRLIALTRSLMAVTKQLGTMQKRTDRSPTIDDFMEEVSDDDSDETQARA